MYKIYGSNNLYQPTLKKEQQDHFVDRILAKLEPFFSNPEDVIVKQGTIANSMYIISRGQCFVNIIQPNQKEIYNFKFLNQGDHFGIVSLIYKCPRTASIISREYNILSRLTKRNFNELMSTFPELIIYMKNHIFSYTDVYKNFMTNIFARITYLTNLTTDQFHQLIYLFKRQKYEKGKIIQMD